MSFILHGMTAMQDKMSSFDTVKSLMQKQTLKGSQRTQTGSGIRSSLVHCFGNLHACPFGAMASGLSEIYGLTVIKAYTNTIGLNLINR